jgi:transposase InsO family protein
VVAWRGRLVDGQHRQRRPRDRRVDDGVPSTPARPPGRAPLRPGAVYTSLAFSQRVADLDLDQSFGSTGDCYDNAAVESFFATLKRELAWIHETKTWATRAALRTALFDYIEGFYNPERIQHRLGQRSPATFEQDQVA